MNEKRKRGRPPKAGGPMSATERQQRYRARIKQQLQVAKLRDHDGTPLKTIRLRATNARQLVAEAKEILLGVRRWTEGHVPAGVARDIEEVLDLLRQLDFGLQPMPEIPEGEQPEAGDKP